MDDNDESKFSKSKNSNSNLPSYPDESKSDKHLENERNENFKSNFTSICSINIIYLKSTKKKIREGETLITHKFLEERLINFYPAKLRYQIPIQII